MISSEGSHGSVLASWPVGTRAVGLASSRRPTAALLLYRAAAPPDADAAARGLGRPTAGRPVAPSPADTGAAYFRGPIHRRRCRGYRHRTLHHGCATQLVRRPGRWPHRPERAAWTPRPAPVPSEFRRVAFVWRRWMGSTRGQHHPRHLCRPVIPGRHPGELTPVGGPLVGWCAAPPAAGSVRGRLRAPVVRPAR